MDLLHSRLLALAALQRALEVIPRAGHPLERVPLGHLARSLRDCFGAALKNRPVILGYYFSSKEGGVSSGAAPAPVFPAGTFSGRRISFTT